MPRIWTDTQRADAATRARRTQPWKHSTGPRTALGKRKSARNSLKHGYFSYEKQIIRWYLRFAASRLKQIRTYLNDQNQKRENELITKYGMKMPFTPDTMAFYPYFKVHPLTARPQKQKRPYKKTVAHQIHDYFTSLGGDDD